MLLVMRQCHAIHSIQCLLQQGPGYQVLDKCLEGSAEFKQLDMSLSLSNNHSEISYVGSRVSWYVATGDKVSLWIQSFWTEVIPYVLLGWLLHNQDMAGSSSMPAEKQPFLGH